ncbi:hypothetical protein CJF32_00008456 [Rutstroemia sp. NJR-2017a WRK4]|nr:hypothetical protein CJF32_00008456 [Rutstroemia sp. NJR-2017a WRK4]
MSLSDEAKLLIAVFQQIDSFPRLDYERLMSDLGLPSAGAAQVRWSRMTTKMKKWGAENEVTGVLKIVPGGAKVKKDGKGKGTELTKKRERDAEEDDEEDGDGELDGVAKKKIKMEKGGLETARKTTGGRKKASLANSLNATTSKPGAQGKESKGNKAYSSGIHMEAMDEDEFF